MHRRTRLRAAAGALALGLLLGGCATSPSEEPMTTATPREPRPTVPGKTPSPQPTTLPLPSDGPTPPAAPATPVPDDVLELPGVREAIAAEAERRGVAPDEVSVVEYADVTWPDGSIGCPQPGMMYTQALVPGRRLLLEVQGEVASYHSGGGPAFGYCANPRPALPATPDTRPR